MFNKNGTLVHTMFGHNKVITVVALGKYLIATGSEDKSVIIYGRQTGNSLLKLRHESAISSIKIYDPKPYCNFVLIITGTDQGFIRVYKINIHE